MQRAKLPSKKDIMLIADYPMESEITMDVPFSAASHIYLINKFYNLGFKNSDFHTTYLSYERPEKDNFDWKDNFVKDNSISDYEAKNNYVFLENTKDTYIEKAFYEKSLKGLLEEIEKVSPKIIVIIGKWSFFLLTDKTTLAKTQSRLGKLIPLGGLSNYRASILSLFKYSNFNFENCILFPMLPPVTKQREPSKLPIILWDFKKLEAIYKKITEQQVTIDVLLNPIRDIVIGDTFEVAIAELNKLLETLNKEVTKVSIDIETKLTTIDCIGFTYIENKAFVLPFLTELYPNFWSEDEEAKIFELLYKILKHKNLRTIGQNFSYDSQYILKYFLVDLKPAFDTMIAFHTLYNYLPKNLAFQASIFVDDYSYWKDMTRHEKEES